MNDLEHFSLPKRLLWLTFLVLAGFVVTSISLVFVSDENTVGQKWLQMFHSTVIFALPAIVFQIQTKSMAQSGYKILPKQPAIWLITVLLMLAALPAINLTKWLNDMLVLPECMSAIEQWMKDTETQANELTKRWLMVDSVWGVLLNLLAVAVFPSVCEELLFRGTLQQTLAKRLNPHVAIWVTAIIFSAVHFQFYGFVPRMLLGAILGYLFWLSGSIWLPIFAHFVNNATAVLTFYFGITDQIDLIGTSDTWWLGLVSAVICTATMLIVAKIFFRKKTKFAL